MPAEAVLQEHFPWCVGWEEQLPALFACYAGAKQAQGVLDYNDLMLYLGADEERLGLGGAYRQAVRPRAGGRVPGHQPPPIEQRSGRRPAIYAFPELLNIAEGRTLI
jgi:hypothetical protein